ncbi:hypothetical protein [uncultured Bartonella sp.]|uniref:hypothetical protein n=1 Tax=uncultured Bartonella sp. TaxID=104108 RepID=UPI002607AE2A|nr:hypothetical protein [uncultured Bartonella sp.]
MNTASITPYVHRNDMTDTSTVDSAGDRVINLGLGEATLTQGLRVLGISARITRKCPYSSDL